MSKISNGGGYLAEHLEKNDYYNENEKIQGQWVGKLAAEFGLDGKTIGSGDIVFDNLRQGLMPDGSEKLTKRLNTDRATNEKDALKALRIAHKYNEGEQPTKEAVDAWIKEHPTVSNRVSFFAFQVAPPKSVSVAAVTFGDDRLLRLHEEASKGSFAELEKFAARQVGNRETVTTGKLLAAEFTHTSNRNLDAQLHSHLVVANVTQDGSGKRWGLTEFQMTKAIEMASLDYQNRMAVGAKNLGYDIETGPGIKTFELSAIPQEMRDVSSSRSAEIEEAVKEFQKKHGMEPSPAERQVLTNQTKTPKMLESSEAENIKLQLSKFTPKQIAKAREKIEAAKAREGQFALNPADSRDALRFAREHLFERSSIEPHHKIEAAALRHGIGKVDLEFIRSAMQEDPNLVKLTDGTEKPAVLTTRQNLSLESESVANCLARQGKEAPFSEKKPVGDLSAWTKEHKGFELKEEQKAAVRHVLENEDGIFSIRGVAGAGKTTMLQEANAQLAEREASMIYLAPSSSAVDTLRKEGFENAMTVSKYLVEVEAAHKRREEHSWKFPIPSIFNLKSIPPHEPLLEKGLVVFVDEAGLQSVKQGHQVQMFAERQHQRLCLVGDSKQHSSVEAGDFMRNLEDHGNLHSSTLSENTRQKPQEYRHAIEDFSRSRYALGWEKLEEWGAIHEGKADYLKNAAADYLEKAKGGEHIDQVLAVAPTHAELDQLNADIRKGLKESGYLKGEGKEIDSFRSANLTDAQKREPASYKPGDVVMFKDRGEHKTVREVDYQKKIISFVEGGEKDLKKMGVTRLDVGTMGKVEVQEGDKVLIRANEKESGLVSGKILTISGFEKDGSIRTKEGDTIPKGFADLKHGYAVTSHASQGKTVDHVVVAAARMDSKALYVSTSRGRETLGIHVADQEKMGSTLRESTRTSALDVKDAKAQLFKTDRETRSQPLHKAPLPSLEAVKRDPHKRHDSGKPVPAREHSAPTGPSFPNPAKVHKDLAKRSERAHGLEKKPLPGDPLAKKQEKTRPTPKKAEEKQSPAKAVKESKKRQQRQDKTTAKVRTQGKAMKGRERSSWSKNVTLKNRLPDSPITPSEKAQERKEASIQRQQTAAPETTKGAIEKRLEEMKAKQSEKQKEPAKEASKRTEKEPHKPREREIGNTPVKGSEAISIDKAGRARMEEGHRKAAKLVNNPRKEPTKDKGGFEKER